MQDTQTSKERIRAEFTEPPFPELYFQAVQLLKLCTELNSTGDQKRVAQAAILTLSIAIEALGNTIIGTLALPKRVYSELEGMKPLGKLDLFSTLTSKTPVAWGEHAYQCISELVSFRNSYVHPKQKKQRALGHPETGLDEHSGNEYCMVFQNLEETTYPHLGISKNPASWTVEDCLHVLGIYTKFLDRYLLKDCRLSKDRLRKTFLMRDKVSGVLLQRSEIPVLAHWIKETLDCESTFLFGLKTG